MGRWFLLFCWGWIALVVQAQALSPQDRQALSALADVLENPARREVLIRELRLLSAETQTPESAGKAQETPPKTASDPPSAAPKASSEAPPAEPQAAPPEEKAPVEEKKAGEAPEAEALKSVTENAKAAVGNMLSLPVKLVESGKGVALEMGNTIRQSWRALLGIFSGRDVAWQTLTSPVVQKRLLQLGVLMVVAWMLYQGGRRLFHNMRRRLQVWVRRGKKLRPFVRRVLAVAGLSAADALWLLVVVFLLATGSVTVFGKIATTGSLGTQITLFLQAFMVIELLKTGIRALFFPRYPGLRLLPAGKTTARFWQRWFVGLINLLGYGYLVLLPLINMNLSWSLGRVFSAVLAFSAFVYGVNTLWRKRRAVHDALLWQSSRLESTLFAATLKVLSWSWHWLAGMYFVMLLVLTVLRADKALPYVLSGTLNTVLVIGGGLLLSGILGHYIDYRFRFSSWWQQRVPGLDKRLNLLVPNALRLLRMAVFWLMVVGVLAAWQVVNPKAWLHSANGQAFVSKWGGVFLIIAFAFVLWLAFTSVIENRIGMSQGDRSRARMQTLLSLLRSALTVLVFSIATMMVLSEIGINIGPLIAGAGVLGLAIGFGAQKLVQDIITGIFFQIENAMNRGDVVTVDGITGRAEHISIRSVGVRDSSGTYHLIPFSNVNRVSNYMRGYANHIAEYSIAYRESIDDAIVQLRAAFDELMQGEMKRYILEPINVHGVTQLADSAVMIRVSIKTTPGDQWLVGRAYNRLVKLYFDAAGIEIPYPHMQVYFAQNRHDMATPPHSPADKEEAHPPTASPEKKPGDTKAKVDTHGAARLPS